MPIAQLLKLRSVLGAWPAHTAEALQGNIRESCFSYKNSYTYIPGLHADSSDPDASPVLGLGVVVEAGEAAGIAQGHKDQEERQETKRRHGKNVWTCGISANHLLLSKETYKFTFCIGFNSPNLSGLWQAWVGFAWHWPRTVKQLQYMPKVGLIECNVN